jgi:hypothetical protein
MVSVEEESGELDPVQSDLLVFDLIPQPSLHRHQLRSLFLE